MLDGVSYGLDFLYGRNRPVVFLDHYHRDRNPAYAESTRVQLAFKHGNQAIFDFFAPIIARIVAYEFQNGITHVVPALGANDLMTDVECTTYKLAEIVARELGAEIDHEAFTQSAPRQKLHGGSQSRPREERERIVREVLRCNGRIAGRSYLVIDDVFTTGSTMSVYAELMEQHGAALYGGATAFRYEDSLELKNPAMYPELSRLIS